MSDARARLSRLAWLLDSSIPIPGTSFTIGLDALIGLVPVVGDIAGVLLSSYIVKEAAALGASKSVLARMALNVAVEGLIGMIPFAGDLFDAAFKANQRNVRLLSAYLDQPVRTRRVSLAFLLGLVLLALVLITLIVVLGVLLARWVWSWF
jgi:hypothetical protein